MVAQYCTESQHFDLNNSNRSDAPNSLHNKILRIMTNEPYDIQKYNRAAGGLFPAVLE